MPSRHHFEPQSFLRYVASCKAPKPFRKVKWRQLYRDFVYSPHFQPWFRGRQQEALEQLHAISRSLRMGSTPATLMEQVGVAVVDDKVVDVRGHGASAGSGTSRRQWDLPESRLAALHAQIWRAIRRETSRLSRDSELRGVMYAHLEALETAMPVLRDSRGGEGAAAAGGGST